MKALIGFVFLFVSVNSFAVEPGKPKNASLKLKNGDSFEAWAIFVGEPVSEPVNLTIKTKCAGFGAKLLQKSWNVCDFVSMKLDGQGRIVLTTKAAVFDEDEGRMACGQPKAEIFKNPCVVQHQRK